MNILFLTTVLPRNERMGGEVASQCFIDALIHNGHQVTVVGYMRKDDIFTPAPEEIVIGRRHIETKKAKYQTLIWLFQSLIKGLPYSSGKYHSKLYLSAVRKLLQKKHYDFIIIDHPQLAWLEELVEDKHRLITISHNIEHEIYTDSYKSASNPFSRWIYKREAIRIKVMENRLASTANSTWTLTDHDGKYFSSLEGVGQVIAFELPPGLTSCQSGLTLKKFDIALIGSWSWKPNEEGLRWFLEKVYPLLPDVTINVAGRGADWLESKHSNIIYRGFVPDAQEFMAQAKVVAIPTLSGGGVQIKTLDAIASGSAIVATPIAMRGIKEAPRSVRIVHQPREFADQLISIIASPTAQSSSHESSNWFVERRKKFLSDIASATEAIESVA